MIGELVDEINTFIVMWNYAILLHVNYDYNISFLLGILCQQCFQIWFVISIIFFAIHGSVCIQPIHSDLDCIEDMLVLHFVKIIKSDFF